jgi:hypothetical protein
MKARIVSLITASLLTASMNIAIACLPPPPTLSRLEGESDDAYARRLEPFEAERVRRDQEEVDRFQRQRDAKNWASADRVLLAEAVTFDDSLLKPKVWLRPVRWLKGTGMAGKWRCAARRGGRDIPNLPETRRSIVEDRSRQHIGQPHRGRAQQGCTGAVLTTSCASRHRARFHVTA